MTSCIINDDESKFWHYREQFSPVQIALTLKCLIYYFDKDVNNDN